MPEAAGVKDERREGCLMKNVRHDGEIAFCLISEIFSRIW